MVSGWVSFPKNWVLADVQAGLTVVIAFLCAGGIFVVVRYCWQVAARRVASQKQVPRYALLSLNTVGEALDVIWLLRRELFQPQYHGLLAQCFMVVLLTGATLLAGFIARSSTRHGQIIELASINGTLPIRGISGLIYADVEVNQTIFNLQRNNFPEDRLLEFLPDQFSDWEYNPSQWNSSWSMACQYTPETPLDLSVTSNCSNDVWTEMPTLNAFYNDGQAWEYGNGWSGWFESENVYKDVLMFLHGAVYNDYNHQFNTTTNMTFRSVALHMHGVPYNSSNSSCSFSEGHVQYANYTVANCNLLRDVSKLNLSNYMYGAGPDSSDLGALVDAMSQHWANRLRTESARNQPISLVNGTELAQFYQAYTIVKDVATGPYVQRDLEKQFMVAQISLACLIICCVGTVVVLAGLINYYSFYFRHRDSNTMTPQSKLDWFLHSVGNDGDAKSIRAKLRHSTISTNDASSETVPLTTVDSRRKERGSMASSETTPFPTPAMVNDGFERSDRGPVSYRAGMPPRVGSGHSGYAELPRDRDYADDTRYDPTAGLGYPVQPIEDGFFQGRWS